MSTQFRNSVPLASSYLDSFLLWVPPKVIHSCNWLMNCEGGLIVPAGSEERILLKLLSNTHSDDSDFRSVEPLILIKSLSLWGKRLQPTVHLVGFFVIDNVRTGSPVLTILSSQREGILKNPIPNKPAFYSSFNSLITLSRNTIPAS